MSEEKDLLEGLNEAQSAAVMHGAGPLLIVAGAGTGKTTVLTRRYVHLLNTEKLKTENILALTFTEKAAGEMEDRVLAQLPNGTYDFWISTFHAFCQRILEQYALEIGLPNRFRLLNETDAWLLLKRRFEELPLDQYRPLGNPMRFLSALQKHISRAKDEGVSPEQYLTFAENLVLDGDGEFVSGEKARLKEIADCYFAYRKILREEGALDFGDLIVETLRLLRERPRVLKELQARFRYVMVDEFQDTNWAQYEMIKLLAGGNENLTVVGDDDQAIYKFRGASLANILQFRDDYPAAKTVALTQNYRSNQEILDCAYNFIQCNNPNRLEVRLKDTGLSKRLEAARGEGGMVDVAWFKTLEDEAEGVAKRIKELKAADPNVKWNEMAILSRSNDGAEPFIGALERHGIPYRFVALRGLYAKPVIVDITAFFSLFDGYHESAAVWRAMTAPCCDFTSREVAGYLEHARRKTGGSLWGALNDTHDKKLQDEVGEAGMRKARDFVRVADDLALAAKRERPLKMLQLVIDKTGYLAKIMKLPEEERIETIGYLNSFANRIKRYEQSTRAPSMKGFMDEFKLEIESGEEGALQTDADAGPEYVAVMTVHASKGLEFTHVFIVSMVDQRFPTRARSEEIPLPDGLVNERLPMEGDAHIEEERRLMYVAMTRAKDSLTLTGADSYGGVRKKKPSAFLGEADLEVPPAEEVAELARLVTAPAPDEDERASTAVHYALKRRFSFTQLAAFRKCPLQYKFEHVYRIPKLGNHQKNFGQCIHNTLHDILLAHVERGAMLQADLFGALAVATAQAGAPQNGFRVTLEECLKSYEEHWAAHDDWYPTAADRERYYAEGREAVKRLHALWSEQIPNVAFLELPFDWHVGEHSLKGSVDRIDTLPEGGHIIFDYKTGRPKTADDIEKQDKEQLWIYQIAMEDKGMDIRRLAYVYIQDGTVVDVPILQGEKREEYRQELVERMQAILISDFQPSPSPFVCKNCDFKNICEFRRL